MITEAQPRPDTDQPELSNEVLAPNTELPKEWWEFAADDLKNRVIESLREKFAIVEGDNRVEIFNCTDLDLTEDEKQKIINAFDHVVNFTGGKILDRFLGIVLARQEDFPEDVAGNHGTYMAVIGINLDLLRVKGKASGGDYGRLFGPDRYSSLEIVLAHEMGHVMDLQYISEVESHGFDMEAEAPEWMGFYDKTDSFSAFGKHFSDGLEEEAPTEYAKTKAKEDFAETFTIAALGGDTSGIPRRIEQLKKTLNLANGTSAIGPKKVELEKIELE